MKQAAQKLAVRQRAEAAQKLAAQRVAASQKLTGRQMMEAAIQRVVDEHRRSAEVARLEREPRARALVPNLAESFIRLSEACASHPHQEEFYLIPYTLQKGHRPLEIQDAVGYFQEAFREQLAGWRIYFACSDHLKNLDDERGAEWGEHIQTAPAYYCLCQKRAATE